MWLKGPFSNYHFYIYGLSLILRTPRHSLGAFPNNILTSITPTCHTLPLFVNLAVFLALYLFLIYCTLWALASSSVALFGRKLVLTLCANGTERSNPLLPCAGSSESAVCGRLRGEATESCISQFIPNEQSAGRRSVLVPPSTSVRIIPIARWLCSFYPLDRTLFKSVMDVTSWKWIMQWRSTGHVSYTVCTVRSPSQLACSRASNTKCCSAQAMWHSIDAEQ
jgi:hypothetical protein